MLPSEEEDFLDTRLVTINGGYLRNNNNGLISDSTSGSTTTITLGRQEPYLHIPPPPSSDVPASEPNFYKSQNPPTNQKWSRGADSLASSWSFTLSLHSLLYLPEAILRHGGVVFLIMYLFLLIIIGLPVLILEIFLGQYSTLPVGRLYRHLCPLLSGLGVSMALICGVRCVLDLGVSMWSSLGMVTMFYEQEVTIHHANNYSLTSLENLQGIVPLNVAALAGVCVITYIFLAAGAKSVGKISLIFIPLCYGLLITLVIRSCMEQAGPQGFLTIMTPNWSVLSNVTPWLEAGAHVIFSLQLGLGVVTNYGGYNKFGHSIIRDCCIIIFGHICWVILAVLLIFSLHGVADNKRIDDNISLPDNNGPFSGVIDAVSLSNVSIIGDGVGMSNIVLVLTTFSHMTHGWLWSALFSILVTMICITDIFGYVEMISNSISYHRPILSRFKPLVSLITIFAAGLIALCFSTQGGAHVFEILQSYIADWPLLLFTVLTMVSSVHCLSMSSIIKFISIMTRHKLTNYSKSHLSVILVTVAPILVTASLGWVLYVLSIKSMDSNSLPEEWGLPLVWSLSSLAVIPLLVGTIWYLTFASRGQIWIKHVRSILKPTSTWHRNQQLHYFGEDQTKVQSLAHAK